MLALTTGSFKSVLIDDNLSKTIATLRPDIQNRLFDIGYNGGIPTIPVEAFVQIVNGKMTAVRMTSDLYNSICIMLYTPPYGEVIVQEVKPCTSILEILT
jgi:hypothetical protein